MKHEDKIRAVYYKAARDMFRLAFDIHMEAEGSDAAELRLYGEIVRDGPEWWKWSKEDKSAAEFKKAIEDVRAKGAKKLTLRINSPGGVCTESVAMRSILGSAGFDEVNIIIEGMCASAATDVATLPGAHVAIAEGSEYMIHNPWCIALGNANEMEHVIERLRNIEQMSRGFYMKRTGQSEEQIKEWMDAETWFTAEQAVEHGFADEVLEADVSGGTQAAACATKSVMAVMQSLYRSVPQEIALADDEPAGDVSDGIPAAGDPTETENNEEEAVMDINELTIEQLRDGNPALYQQVQEAAVEAERARIDDIDALTLPGYEELAAQAKADGTSAMDFQKQVVAAQKKKGADFLSSRKEETAPAQNVTGGEPRDNQRSQNDEINDAAKSIAEYATQYTAHSNNGMF